MSIYCPPRRIPIPPVFDYDDYVCPPDAGAGAGTLGFQGNQGFQGQQGRQGLLGDTGFSNDGLQGYQGVGGLQGIEGVQGWFGLQGSTGLDGTNGVQGVQGATGISLGFTGFYYDCPTGGTALEITNVPSGWKYIQGTSQLQWTGTNSGSAGIQIGDGGGFLTSNTGYTGGVTLVSSGNTVNPLGLFTDAFRLQFNDTADRSDTQFAQNFQLMAMDDGRTAVFQMQNTPSTSTVGWANGFASLPNEMTQFRILHSGGRTFASNSSVRIWYV